MLVLPCFSFVFIFFRRFVNDKLRDLVRFRVNDKDRPRPASLARRFLEDAMDEPPPVVLLSIDRISPASFRSWRSLSFKAFLFRFRSSNIFRVLAAAAALGRGSL